MTPASIEGQRAEDTTEQRVLLGSVGGQTVRDRRLARNAVPLAPPYAAPITAPRLRNKHHEFATLELARSIASLTLVP